MVPSPCHNEVMNEITIPASLSEVDKAIFLVRLSDKAVSATREVLYKIFAEKLWEGRFTSWNEFVKSTDGLAKSPSWASKNLAVYEHFVINAGMSQDELEMDTEKLYLASKTDGTPAEQLNRAKTLDREDLRIEGSEIVPHTPEWVKTCKICNVSEHSHI